MNKIYSSILALFFFSACTKSSFLETKPNTGIVVPTTLDDMQQLLGNDEIQTNISPVLGLMNSDEYHYPTVAVFNSRPTRTEKNSYMWKQDIYEGEKNIADWNTSYQAVFYSNVVLDAWNKLPDDLKNSDQGKLIKGTALYTRGRNFFNLAEVFSPAYDSGSNALGIPLKLSSDINEINQRATQKQTYNQIIADLTEAAETLPISVDVKLFNFPTKVSAYGLLARISLYMRDYSAALSYANSALQLKSDLLDYNTLNPSATRVFSTNNAEIIDYKITHLGYSTFTVRTAAAVGADTTLISLYDANDLRKAIYFRTVSGVVKFVNCYTGSLVWPFMGLATDELYLIKAECLARAGRLTEAITTLNALLIKRYKTNLFTPYFSSDQNAVINKILIERRKELVWRGLRWQDVKRLNKEGANITLTRQFNGQTYVLPPNDPRYIMPIPDDEIALSNIQQNQR